MIGQLLRISETQCKAVSLLTKTPPPRFPANVVEWCQHVSAGNPGTGSNDGLLTSSSLDHPITCHKRAYNLTRRCRRRFFLRSFLTQFRGDKVDAGNSFDPAKLPSLPKTARRSPFIFPTFLLTPQAQAATASISFSRNTIHLCRTARG